jgi:SAM-dependent methyltransferase
MMTVARAKAENRVLPVRSCPVCEAEPASRLYRLDFGDIMRCHGCRTVYTVFRERDRFDAANRTWGEAAWIRGRVLSQPYLQRTAHDRLGHLRKHVGAGTLLEVGPNTGEFLAVAARAGFRVTGVDWMDAVLPMHRLPAITLYEMDLMDLPGTGAYDAVTAFHVLEHVSSPARFLGRVWELLAPQGILFLEVPNFASWDRRLWGKDWDMFLEYHHLHYEPSTLRRLLEDARFEVLEVSSRHEPQRWLTRYYNPVKYWVWQRVRHQRPRRNAAQPRPEPASQREPHWDRQLYASRKARLVRYEHATVQLASMLLYPLAFVQERRCAGCMLRVMARRRDKSLPPRLQ